MSSDTESRQRRVGEDVTVALHRPAELFSVRPEAMLERDARIEPGADEIVNELLGGSGLWYPFDLLFFARQPLKREALIVDAISRMPLLVQPVHVGPSGTLIQEES